MIIEWHKKVSKKYVPKELAEKIHKNAAPFVTWLQEVSFSLEIALGPNKTHGSTKI